MSSNPVDKPWNSTPAGGRLLRPNEVARIIGLSRSQIYQMIKDGDFPPFIKLSERASAMPEAWLNAFIASRVEIMGSPNVSPDHGGRKHA